jgi:hypothetical protein
MRRALQGSGGVEYTCVHKDGFAVDDAPYTPGASMNWPGKLITQDNDDYYAFNKSRSAIFFQDGSKTFGEYFPCFVRGKSFMPCY